MANTQMPGAQPAPMTGYCVKCKEKQEMKDPKPVTKETKRGPVNFMTGTCPKCGTSMWRVVSRGPKKAA